MNDSLTYPPITEELLSEAVRRMLSVGSPEKIVLFGSHAQGTAHPESDLDLLIIEETNLRPTDRQVRYRRVLGDLHPSKDILVRTPAEVRDWSRVPNAFLTTALREGRVLYERRP